MFSDLFGNQYSTSEIMAKLIALSTLLVNKGVISMEEYKKSMSEENLNNIVEKIKIIREEQYEKMSGEGEV